MYVLRFRKEWSENHLDVTLFLSQHLSHFLWSFFLLCCSPDIVCFKIHVQIVRYLLDMYVEVLVEMWLRGSAYWLRYQ